MQKGNGNVRIYPRPLECELKVREQAEYRGLYCGLCKSIGRRYGQLERLTLSYDCAFLALVLYAIAGGARFSQDNCGPRIYRGKRPIADASPALDYAADVNVLLAWYKAADDAADEKSASATVSRLALLRAYRKAAGVHPRWTRRSAGAWRAFASWKRRSRLHGRAERRIWQTACGRRSACAHAAAERARGRGMDVL
jgi:hypothetical protein